MVVGHGVGDSLESFTDFASRLNARGHTVLLLDFRGHGGSDAAYTTLGGREREDVRAAAQSLRDRGLAGSGLVFVGFSMGAVAVLRAAVDQPDVKRGRGRGAVRHLPRTTSPTTPGCSTRSPAGCRSSRSPSPSRDGGPASTRTKSTPWRRLAACARRSWPSWTAPTTRMPETVVRRILDAHPGPKRLWVAPGAGHVGASLSAGYWPVVLGFLEENGV